jgi:hypothetical protein
MQSRLVQQKSKHSLRSRSYSLTRILHLYSSMVSLFVVLFFSATGITLNHPDLVFGNAESIQNLSGTLGEDWQKSGEVDWLMVAESLRATHRLKGQVSNYRSDHQEASIGFRAPAYAADAFIQMSDGSYTIKVVAEGPVAVLNDLHRGRDAGRAWAWLIDISGGFLLLVSATGLILSLFLRKTRRAAVLTALGGTVVVVILMQLTH